MLWPWQNVLFPHSMRINFTRISISMSIRFAFWTCSTVYLHSICVYAQCPRPHHVHSCKNGSYHAHALALFMLSPISLVFGSMKIKLILYHPQTCPCYNCLHYCHFEQCRRPCWSVGFLRRMRHIPSATFLCYGEMILKNYTMYHVYMIQRVFMVKFFKYTHAEIQNFLWPSVHDMYNIMYNVKCDPSTTCNQNCKL